MATNTRCNRSINTSMLAASNTSVRNSTAPADPGGLAGLGPAFGQRKRQVHAGGVGVRRHGRDLHITQAQPGGRITVLRVLPGQHHLHQRMMGQATGPG